MKTDKRSKLFNRTNCGSKALRTAALLTICAITPALIWIGGGTNRPAELELSYRAFDQDLTGGWRRLAREKRFREAAELIDRYVAETRDLHEWQRVNLQFHAGQLYAMAEDETSAMNRFKSAVFAQEPPDSPVKWNAYVLATIAFLEQDYSRLTALREEIARGPQWNGKAPNLDVVDRLIQDFGKSYAVAYSGDASKPQ
jgi:hypothetical protein